jgi:hypothetical protein
MAEVSRKRALDGDTPANTRKKLRPSELPLSQTKRSAIDSLVHTFRKKGQYDSIRKELMAQYASGVRVLSTYFLAPLLTIECISPLKMNSCLRCKNWSIERPTATLRSCQKTLGWQLR